LATDRLDGIDPATASSDATVRIARVLYAVGERARPVAWHRAALSGTSVATSRLDLARLIPLSLAAAAIDPPGSFAAWAEAEAAAIGTSTEARIRVAAVAEILDALGVRVPTVDGRDALFAEPGRSPDPPTALWSTLEAASAAGRIAETALAAIGLLGPDGPASAGASATAAAIRGLVAIGFVDEARAIAREAILARLE